MKSNLIDCGHGGTDSGALGIKNIKEKDITLEIGNLVNKLLIENSDIINHMTRTQDKTMSLSTRTDLSNRLKVNTQVSIHTNAYKDPKAKGFEIFYMSNNGKALAQCILNEFKQEKLYTTLRDGGLKYKNLHMNREAKATSCLVELGFITNQEDLNLILKNKEKMAVAIAKGICKYNNIPYIVNKPLESEFKNGEYSGRYAIVTTKELNVRYDRGTNHEVINKLKSGDKVRLGYCLNKWVAIHGFKGNKGFGYVHTDYLKLT